MATALCRVARKDLRWTSRPGQISFSTTVITCRSSPARSHAYFQDQAIVSPPLKFDGSHQFRKVNRAMVWELERLDQSCCVWLDSRSLRPVGVGIVSLPVDMHSLIQVCNVTDSRLNGWPVSLGKGSNKYRGIICGVSSAHAFSAHVSYSIIIQDCPDNSIMDLGGSLMLRSCRPSLPGQRMLSAVDRIAKCEIVYSRMLKHGSSKIQDKVPLPEVYYAILGQTMPSELAEFSQRMAAQSRPADRPRAKHPVPLTPVQERIVEKAFTQVLTLVQGPPGTGKSTVAGALVQRGIGLLSSNPKAKILLLSPSNIASDNLARISHSLGLRTIRINSEMRMKGRVEPVPLDLLDICLDTKVVEHLRRIPTPHYLEKKGIHIAADFAASCYRGESRRHRQEFMRLRNSTEADILASCDVIAATCNSSAMELFNDCEFPLVIVDEATQGIEPDVLLAVCRCQRHLVLIGDQCQLGPTMIPALSLFERLILAGHPTELLDTQYRMHPKLMEFSNKVLYENRLHSGVTKEDRQHTAKSLPWPNNSPLLFIAVQGLCVPNHRTSYVNDLEARCVTDIVGRMLADVEPSSIGVITPYAGQRDAIKVMLAQQMVASSNVEVSSVDGFQGREKDYIIISCVRSNSRSIGFLRDCRRLNVAITRAKRGLVVVGNPETLAADPLWNDFLVLFQENEALMCGNSLDELRPYSSIYQDKGYRFDLLTTRDNQLAARSAHGGSC